MDTEHGYKQQVKRCAGNEPAGAKYSEPLSTASPLANY